MRPTTPPLNAALLTVLAVATVAGATPCTCSCCGVRAAAQWEQHAACTLLGGDCSGECAADSRPSASYEQFCFEDCAPSAGACALAQKLDHELPDEVKTPERALPASPEAQQEAQTLGGSGPEAAADAHMLEEQALRAKAAKIRRAPKEKGFAAASPKAALLHQQPAGPTPTQLAMAKASMLEAKVHAKAAGAAARRAKESYELSLRSSREMAEYAGRLVYQEIQREAGEQAKKALQIRQDYVKAAQDAAVANAKGAAAPYKKAAGVAVNTAGMWNLRAGEFAGSAGALKSQAETMAKDAQKYTDTQDWADAEMYKRQAHQLVAQSNEMADRADAAHKQANDIQSSLNWYALAGRGAAASALAGSMPYDVAPPPLPNTVFL